MSEQSLEMPVSRKNRADWERINALWEKDKKPQKQFCAELGINYTSFSYWRYTLSKDKQQVDTHEGFALARTASPIAKQMHTVPIPIKVSYRNGVVINLCCDLNKIRLSELRTLIEVIPCR